MYTFIPVGTYVHRRDVLCSHRKASTISTRIIGTKALRPVLGSDPPPIEPCELAYIRIRSVCFFFENEREKGFERFDLLTSPLSLLSSINPTTPPRPR